MNTLDIIILIVFLLGAVLGMMKGFVKQLASLAGLVIGLLAAKMLYIPVAEKISGTLTDSMTFAQIIAFIAIWIAVPWLSPLWHLCLPRLWKWCPWAG